MRKSIVLCAILLFTVSCKKNQPSNEEDYRTPYTGIFAFTTVKSTMIMCYDTVFPCINGWKEINIDTTLLISVVDKQDTNRIKIQFGNSIIGVDDRGDTISQTLYPILSLKGDLTLPEYPIGGHNNFTGFYKGHDTIKIHLQFGYGIGGFDKYKILGIRF